VKNDKSPGTGTPRRERTEPERPHQRTVARRMLELILTSGPRLSDALGNLMHRQALGNRNRDDDEITIDQMAHHVGNPLPALERINRLA